MGAEVGFIFLWGVIIASMVKFFIQLELGRQCILYDDTTIDVLDRLPGPRLGNTSWIAWLCVVGYFSVFVALIGILGSVAGLVESVAPIFSNRQWAGVVFLLMTLLLFRGRYDDLEKMVTFLVAALKDPLFGNLDRVQMIKGWRDSEGELHEKVYNIAWGDAAKRKRDANGTMREVGKT